jgi:Flp pilus assembly protein TadG
VKVSVRARANERGVAIYVTSVLLVMIVPMAGLAIDGTMLYIDKCRLQGAVDGAALAAAKALARGSDDPTQQANAKTAAATYVMLNYPSSYFFTTSLTVNQATDVIIDESVAQQRTITVTAHATVPTLLMRYLNFSVTNVNAAAQTVRRDVNIALVVDRSGSLALTNSCVPLQQSAINFVSKFSNGRDEISLITFASSTHVDFPIANNFQTAVPSVPAMIGGFSCAGSTSSAMGLWYGYDQLVGLNEPGALNVILFFTDGKPTGVNVNMPLAGGSPCNSAHSGSPRWINGLYNTYTNVNQFFGVLNPTNSGTITNGDFNPTSDSNTGAGCNYMSGWSGNVTDTSDFAGVPTTDVFGDDLNNGYQAITLAGGYIDLGNANNSAAMAMNGADDAATQIRNGHTLCQNAPAPTAGCTSLLTHTGSLSGVIIYSIGLGNAPYPISTDLLKRVSNDPLSTIYDSTKPAGLFVAAPTSADIDAAFAAVASEILRLSR